MTMDDLRDRLQDLFRDVFDDDEIVLADALTAADVDGWDSLAHVNLMIAVEEEFDVRFATAEIASMQDVGSLVALLGAKLGA